MKFSYNWLKELSKTKESAKKIAEKLTLHSFEVEEIKELGKNLDKVIVGEVMEVKKHPDADKLNITKVNVGKKELLQIVCGAPNIAKGQKVPVALVGAVLGEDFEIKEAKLRGIDSQGMICAEDELGLGNNHDGIMVIDENAPLGKNFAEYLNLNDIVMDIDILPNRGHDALSYEGVAREITTLTGGKNKNDSEKIKKKVSKLDISINTDKCSRYIGAKITGIRVEKSPSFIKARLIASGLKPINNIVDITNYIMLETGQPLHAFDANRIEKISVRLAKKDEELVLLDDTSIKLKNKDIVITDGKSPVALAGIMGGNNSEINENTTDIILEAASFDAVSVRTTQKNLNLHTDAGYRFERDLDSNIAEHAAKKAIDLIISECGGNLEAISDVYPNPISPWTINLSIEKVNKLLGVEIDKKEIIKIIESLSIGIKKRKNILIATVPTRRIDLQSQEDLIEEIGRIYGYEKISPSPLVENVQVPHKNEQRFFERSLKDIAVLNRFDETRGYSFYSKKDAEALGLNDESHTALMNPMNPDQALVRRTLVSGLLRACKKSLSYFDEVHIFDVGKIYTSQKSGFPKENLNFSLAVAEKGQEGEQFFLLKGIVDDLLYRSGISDWYYDDSFNEDDEDVISLHPSRKALIKASDGEVIGVIGEASKKAHKHFGLKKVRVAISEIDVNYLLKHSSKDSIYETLAKFPEVERDLSIIVDEKTRVADVERVLYLAGNPPTGGLVKDIDLFDLYINPKTLERSMAFHIRFSHPERTLKAEEVDEKISEMIKATEKELGITIKS